MIFQCILLNFTDISFQYGSISGKMVFLDIRSKSLRAILPRQCIHLLSSLSRWILDWFNSVRAGINDTTSIIIPEDREGFSLRHWLKC